MPIFFAPLFFKLIINTKKNKFAKLHFVMMSWWFHDPFRFCNESCHDSPHRLTAGKMSCLGQAKKLNGATIWDREWHALRNFACYFKIVNHVWQFLYHLQNKTEIYTEFALTNNCFLIFWRFFYLLDLFEVTCICIMNELNKKKKEKGTHFNYVHDTKNCIVIGSVIKTHVEVRVKEELTHFCNRSILKS